MNIRSMTGYAQVKNHVDDDLTVSLSLKSVNHRFLEPTSICQGPGGADAVR